MKIKMSSQFALCVVFMLSVLSSCAVYEIQDSPQFDKTARWVMLPILNHSDTPEAGSRSADIALTLLRTKGLIEINQYMGSDENADLQLNQDNALKEAIIWAKMQGYQYAVSGSVQEWRYKSGLDAEPVAGITLTVMDLSKQQIVWSASGSKTGWGRDSVSGVAHQLMAVLIKGLSITD